MLIALTAPTSGGKRAAARPQPGRPKLAMPEARSVTLTRLLRLASRGDSHAEQEAYRLLEAELRGLAARSMRRQPAGHTLQTTALVNEAYLRLCRLSDREWTSREHFLAVAARAMRSVLVDHARAKRRQKRDPGVPLAERAAAGAVDPRVLDLDAGLERLEAIDPQAARVVELRFFGGLTSAEAARVLGISLRSCERVWQYARAWLHRELS